MNNDISRTEKTQKTVNIYPSTYDLIIKNKGDYSLAVFIDIAVHQYVKSLEEESNLSKILTQVNEIRDAVRTNLGLNCEVLKQAGILNGNGEIEWLKKDNSNQQKK